MANKLSHCRYYKGGNRNPYVDDEGIAGYFWIAEYDFVNGNKDGPETDNYSDRLIAVSKKYHLPIELIGNLWLTVYLHLQLSGRMNFENQFMSWYLTGEYPLKH